MGAPSDPLPLRELVLQPDWSARLGDVTRERTRTLIRQADALRDEEGSAPTALSVYRALQDAIDPSDPVGCERAEWVLDHVRAGDQEFTPLLRRTASTAARSFIRQRAGVALGVFRLAAGDGDEAESVLLGVLATCRGTGSKPERAACFNLARVYRQGWRVFEALVLARHATRLFREVEDPVRELYSLTEARAVLCGLREWDAMDATSPRIEELLRDLPERIEAESRTNLWYWELVALQARERWDEALVALDQRPVDVLPGAFNAQPWWRASERARCLTGLGRLEEAARLFAEALEQVPPDSEYRWQARQMQAVCAARRGERALAAAVAEEFLSVPRSGLTRDMGAGTTMQLLVQLGEALREAGLERAARQVFDRAAACAGDQIMETERAVRTLPELAEVEESDRAALARARLRFAREHRELLASLAALFERASAAGEPWLDALRGDHDFAAVCAWCARVRAEDGAWVPVGHFLPQEGPVRLTHGICEPCAERARRRPSL